MNLVFFTLILVSFVTSAWKELSGESGMTALSTAMIDTANSSVELALGLIGVMTLFLGLMKIAETGGMLTILARLIRPLLVHLFPEVPPQHPAMGAMILNLSANLLGLGNAATPFGIRAMQDLETLNPHPGTATSAMILFLAINTSSVTLLPTEVIALRAASGSANPAGIVPTTLVATVCSTVTAIVIAKLCEKRIQPDVVPQVSDPTNLTHLTIQSYSQEKIEVADSCEDYPLWLSSLTLVGLLMVIPLTIIFGNQLSPWILPGLMLGFLSFGIARRVNVYEVFVEGAREGFQVGISIIPFLVAILVAVGMLRASGALDWLVGILSVITEPLGLPGEALPMALLRPLSGSGSYGIMADILKNPAIGPDSYTGYLVSTIMGCTETTFYVLAVYFGAVQIRRIRYALIPALAADLVGIIGSVLICSFLYGGSHS
jgi:spore maturation protein SpmA